MRTDTGGLSWDEEVTQSSSSNRNRTGMKEQLQGMESGRVLRSPWTWKTLKRLVWREHPSLMCPTSSTIIMNTFITRWCRLNHPTDLETPDHKSRVVQTAQWPDHSKSHVVWTRHEERRTSVFILSELLLANSYYLFPLKHSWNEANAQILKELAVLYTNSRGQQLHPH